MKRYQWVLLGVGIALLGSAVGLALWRPKTPLPVTGTVASAGMLVITGAVASSRVVTITFTMGGRSNGGNGNGAGR